MLIQIHVSSCRVVRPRCLLGQHGIQQRGSHTFNEQQVVAVLLVAEVPILRLRMVPMEHCKRNTGYCRCGNL